jgi:hypothetical protein
MVLRNTLLQRHTTEHPILNPLVSTHTPIDESNIEQGEEMSLFQQVPREIPMYREIKIRNES